MNELSWETMQQILLSKQPSSNHKHREYAPVIIQQLPSNRKRNRCTWRKITKKEEP